MLYSLIATVIVDDAAELAPTTGHFAHALFLDLVRQVDPELAEALHAPSDRKPFTVSPVLHEVEDRPLTGVVRPGQRGRLRFTILDDRVFAALIQKFRREPTTVVRAGSARLTIADVSTVPGGWSGATTLEEISAGARPSRSVTLEFVTPTSFSLGSGPSGARLSFFPTATLVFNALRRRWDKLAGPALDERLEPLLSQQLVETGYDLRTLALQMDHRPEIGFVGWCRYEAKGVGWDDDTLRQLNALADVAFYTGVGRKTTMGMGQTRRIRGMVRE
ncbi:MAG: CRISPR-associated endoribonuclease Cas6 [Chloroflexota bacterium]